MFFLQYAEHFAACLVDARLLDHLSKKDLEKYLGKLLQNLRRKVFTFSFSTSFRCIFVCS